MKNTIKNTIRNLASVLKSGTTYDIKVATAVAKIPGINVDGIKVWSSYDSYKVSENISITAKEHHWSFQWMDHEIHMFTAESTEKMVVEIDGVRELTAFWSAQTGHLDMTYHNGNEKRWQKYLHERFWDILWDTSWHSASKWAMNLSEINAYVTYGRYKIEAKDASLIITAGNEKWRLGNEITGAPSWETNTPTEVLEFVKRNFTTARRK